MTDDPIICKKCGKENHTIQEFCSRCGRPLNPDSDIENTARSSQTSTSSELDTIDFDTGNKASDPSSVGLNPTMEEDRMRVRGHSRKTRGSTFHPALAFVVAVVLTVGFFLALSLSRPETAFLWRVFMPAGGLALVPQVIMLLFFWSVSILLFRGVSHLRDRRFLHYKIVADLPGILELHDGPRRALEYLRSHPKNDQSLLLSRIVLILDQWNSTRSIVRIHELLHQQSELDSDSAASNYALVRVFIWAMPIVGFIGTVLGISLSVGGFSEFLLNQTVEDIAVVREHLDCPSPSTQLSWG